MKVYILGNDETAMDVKLQIETAHELLRFGFIPFVPANTHFMDIVKPRADWIAYKRAWLLSCDVVYRLKNLKQFDGLVTLAKENDIPVFMDIYALDRHKSLIEKVDRVIKKGWMK